MYKKWEQRLPIHLGSLFIGCKIENSFRGAKYERVQINNKSKVFVNPEVNVADLQELIVSKKYHPYIDLSLKETIAKAVWDTGAGITVVDLNFIKSNAKAFEEIETSSSGTDSIGAIQETPMFMMKTPRIANIEFPSHKVAGVDLSHVNSSTEIPMDMILGYNTLSKANWYFDFPNKKWAVLK